MLFNCLTKFSTILATVSATLSEVSEFFLSKYKGDIEEYRFFVHNPIYCQSLVLTTIQNMEHDEKKFLEPDTQHFYCTVSFNIC